MACVRFFWCTPAIDIQLHANMRYTIVTKGNDCNVTLNEKKKGNSWRSWRGGAKEGEGYIAVVVVHSVYIRKSPARVLTNPPVALPLFQLARIFRRKK